MSTMKVVTTAELKELNNQAISKKYNRALSDDCIKQLKLEGLHLISSIMIHNGTEHRCQLLLKFHKMKLPVMAFLDVGLKEYSELKDAPQEQET